MNIVAFLSVETSTCRLMDPDIGIVWSSFKVPWCEDEYVRCVQCGVRRKCK